MDVAEDGTQNLTQVPQPWVTPLGCDYHWKSALVSLLLQAYRAEAEISTVLPDP